MADQPPLAATGGPPDFPLFGSFRSNNTQSFNSSKNAVSSKNPNATTGSSSVKTVAPPYGTINRQQSGSGPLKRSYSEVVKPAAMKTRFKHDLHLFGKVKPHPGVRSSLRDGAKVVSICSAVNQVLSEPFQWAVVGKFSHGVPKLNQIGKFFASFNLNGKFALHWLSPRQVMVILDEESDFVRVWLGKIWQVGGFPMRVSKWSPSFDTKVESPIVPVWIRLPGLPAHFFDRGVLFEIASNVGKPIRVDSATAFRFKLSEARFCVELNLLLPRVDFLFLEFEGNMRKQRVVYESLPVFCSSCSHVGHGAEECYRSRQELKPVVKVNVDKQSNDVDGCVVSSARTLVHSEKLTSAPYPKLQLIKGVFEHVNGVLKPIFKLPEVYTFGFMGLKFSYESAALLTRNNASCVITEMEEGEIFEDGDGCVVVKDGLDVFAGNGGDKYVSAVHALISAGRGQIKKKIGEGHLAMNSAVLESVDDDAVGNYKLVVPKMVLFSIANSNMATHAPPVHAFKNGNSDVSHLLERDVLPAHFKKCVESAVVFGGESADDLMRSDVTEKMAEDDVISAVEAGVGGSKLVEEKRDGVNSGLEFVSSTLPLHVIVHANNKFLNSNGLHLMEGDHAAVVGGELMHAEVMEKSALHAPVHTFNCAVVSEVVDQKSAAEIGVKVVSDVTEDVGDDVTIFGLKGGPGSLSGGPDKGILDGPDHDSFGPTVNSQQNGLQSVKSVHTSKINEGTNTSKPFRLFKDKRQMDKMDGILKSGILRKPVRNVQGNKPCGESKNSKTPLQLAQEELSKGGAFDDFVITDSHTSKQFSNMDFMARRSWADDMEDEVD